MAQKAPDFTLTDNEGNERSLQDYAGKWLLVYFYPKDDTPGCTKEACGFRDAWEELQESNIEVVGISADNEKSHRIFAQKYSLPFPLLVDMENEVSKKFGAYGEKKMFGNTFMGIKRQSYLIDPDGNIVKEYLKVKPAKHAEEVLEDVQELASKE